LSGRVEESEETEGRVEELEEEVSGIAAGTEALCEEVEFLC
jgi:hypothetical protein